MKRTTIYFLLSLYFCFFCGCDSNSEHKIIITNEDVGNNKDCDWIKYGMVNHLTCFIDHDELHYRSAKSDKSVVYYRYIDGSKQFSCNGYGTKRLIRNPYSKITVKDHKSGKIRTLNVSHYTWCYEEACSDFDCVKFFPDL